MNINTRSDTAGHDLVNWNDRSEIDAISITFAKKHLESLPSFGKMPEGYAGDPYNATYEELNLIVENIAPGYYHVSLRDYSCGRTCDLGDGTYDYDYDEHPGWSDIERILFDLQRRIAASEIDLDSELAEYYTVGGNAQRTITSRQKEEKEARMTGSMTEAQLKRLVGTAGKTFLGLNMRAIIESGAHVSDGARAKLIDELYENQAGWEDSNISGTYTRVNAAVRIINAGEAAGALESVIAGNYRVSADAKQAAKSTLEALRCGALRV